MRKLVAMFAAILTLTVALGFTVGAQTDSTPEANATPDERLCATPLAEMDGTPAAASPTILASPEGGSPVAVVPCGTPLGSPVTGDQPADETGTQEVELVMEDIAFDPTELTIPADVDVTIELTNDGMLPHNFAVPSEGIQSEDYGSGASGSIVVNLPAGTYEFICSVPGHADAGMRGTLIVEG
jgi:nitrite reductase (NO-forming)